MSAITLPTPETSTEQHLAALNEKIRAVGDIAHPFTKDDLLLRGETPEESSPTPLTETAQAVDVGAGHIQVVLKANFGSKPDGSANLGQFTPFFMEKNTWGQTGAVQIVETTSGDDLPKEAVGEVRTDGNLKKLAQLNEEIQAAAVGINGMAYKELDIPDLVDYKLQDLNHGRFVVATITNTSGQTFPVALNIKDKSSGNEGAIFAARNPANGEFHMAKQPKPVIGSKVIGPPQGFAVATDDMNSGIMKILADEFGVPAASNSIDMRILDEDITSCLVADRFVSLNLNAADVSRLDREELRQNMQTQLEKLGHEKVSREDAVLGLANDRFVGAHARTGIGLSLLARGELVLNPKVDPNLGLVLQKVRPGFDPRNVRLTLPHGAVSLGADVGAFSKDPTKFRDLTPIRKVGKGDLLPGSYVHETYRNIFDSMIQPGGLKSDLGVIETATIITHAVKNGILVPNF